MLKRFFLFFTIIIIHSCSSIHQTDDKPIYADTDGFSLLFKIDNKTKGRLFIDDNKDSLVFNYEFKKTSKSLYNFKAKKEKKTIIYEYYIQYPESKKYKYEVLNKYDTLIFLKKRFIFRYESHNK